jgi:hypothetical protein
VDSTAVRLKRTAPTHSGGSAEMATCEAIKCIAEQYSTVLNSMVEYVPWMSANGPCLRAPPEKPSACR